MRLVAIHILEHYLFEKPQTINLVGKYFYSFKTIEKKIVIDRVKNEGYVRELHSTSITELSAIVGANGSGKTTLFSIINKFNDDTKAIFVYENKVDELTIENRTGKTNKHGNITEVDSYEIFFNDNKLENKVNIDIPILYYSPIADEDLSRFGSSISKTSHFKSTLVEYHLDNVERSLMLMTDEIVDEIKKVYPQLPLYDYLNIQAKTLYKKDLRNTYGGFKKEGDIERIQKLSLDKLWGQYKNKDKEHLVHENKDFFKDIEVNIFSYLIIDGTSMQTAFNGSYEVLFENIIKEGNFYKKLTHFFFHKLAYIDKYIYNELHKRYKDNNYFSLLTVLEETNFDEELKGKKEILISKINKLKDNSKSLPSIEFSVFVSNGLDLIIAEELQSEEFNGIKTNLSKYIDHLFTKYRITSSDFIGKVQSDLNNIEIGINKSFDSIFEARLEIIDQLKSGVKRSIHLFDSIKNFYSMLNSMIHTNNIELNSGNITINLKELVFKEFKKVIHLYKKVIQELNSNSLIDAQLIEFRPNKRLSFGEKSLINLFSSLYQFTIKKHHYLRRKGHYILLLDEADLGFHPLWKKKFISVITKVTPLIFNKLNEEIDNSSTPELEKRKIQIIISTHDSITLSDIPNYNIVYIDRLINGKSDVLNILEDNSYRPKQSFGANVHDLLANSFFLDDGFMGEFAKEKIEEVITWINKSKESKKEISKKQYSYYKKVISIIDEPIIRIKLSEMIEELMDDNKEFQKEMIQKEIDFLQKKKDNLS